MQKASSIKVCRLWTASLLTRIAGNCRTITGVQCPQAASKPACLGCRCFAKFPGVPLQPRGPTACLCALESTNGAKPVDTL